MKFVTGNILDSGAEALVNTVNTVGVMGKGIALQFKMRYPLNFELYAAACKKGELQIGKMFVTPTNSIMNPKWIINFPTKQHWMHKSQYAYIETGLDDLLLQIQKLNIRSVAIPPLGSGQGGLDWVQVRRIIEEKLGSTTIEITVFEPVTGWSGVQGNTKTHLTKARALILALINQYRQLGFDVSLLEIQKLAYFLQRMGQDGLQLNYKQYYYGPYANNLQHLLHELEKGYLKGEKPVHDSKPSDLIYVNSSTVREVDQFIETECSDQEKNRLMKIVKIIEGFESPFGLELLSTVDWIMSRETLEITPDDIKEKIALWSKRKDEMFNLNHIHSAQQRLKLFAPDLSYR